MSDSETEVTIAWASQVPVDVLAGHLQAYAETLPALNALRLCNRFGRGTERSIKDLPIELVEQIEGYLLPPVQREQRERWTKALSDEHLKNKDFVFSLSYWMLRQETEYQALVQHNKDTTAKVQTFFEAQRAFLRHNFGLHVWLHLVDMTQYPFDEPVPLTASLVIADSPAQERIWPTTEQEIDSTQLEDLISCPSNEDEFGFRDMTGPKPSKKSLERFSRAMKLLDLEPIRQSKTHLLRNE